MFKVGDFECYDASTALAVSKGLQSYKSEKEQIIAFYRSRGAVAARYYDGWVNQEKSYTQFPYAEFLDKLPDVGDLIALDTLFMGRGWIEFARITKIDTDAYGTIEGKKCKEPNPEYYCYYYTIEQKIAFDLKQGGEINTHPLPHLVKTGDKNE